MTYFFKSKITKPTKTGRIYKAKDGYGEVAADKLTISSPLYTFVYKFDEDTWFMLNRKTNQLHALGKGASPTLTLEITKLHDLEYFESILDWNDIQNEIEFWGLVLKLMDYKTSKRIDGDYTDEEWEQIVVERRELRQQIRELEQLAETNKLEGLNE